MIDARKVVNGPLWKITRFWMFVMMLLAMLSLLNTNNSNSKYFLQDPIEFKGILKLMIYIYHYTIHYFQLLMLVSASAPKRFMDRTIYSMTKE